MLEKLKAKKPRGSKPFVIMITGNTGKRHQTWAESLGADDYINKPFRMDRLIESVEEAARQGLSRCHCPVLTGVYRRRGRRHSRPMCVAICSAWQRVVPIGTRAVSPGLRLPSLLLTLRSIAAPDIVQ